MAVRLTPGSIFCKSDCPCAPFNVGRCTAPTHAASWWQWTSQWTPAHPAPPPRCALQDTPPRATGLEGRPGVGLSL
eukprot:227914-Chlamydomonas_euryale.AAC.1